MLPAWTPARCKAAVSHMLCAKCPLPQIMEATWSVMWRAVRLLREELQLLQEPGSYVGEVVKVMGKTKVLCKVHPEGKYVVDLDKVSAAG